MNKKTKKIMLFFLVFVLSISLIRYYGAQFRSNHILTFGTVIKCDGGGKGNFGPGVYYKYYVNGKWIENSRLASEFPYGIGKIINGHSFPVAYRKYWYGYASAILMTPRDFDLYGHPFPDSLQWVIKYMNK